MAIAAALAVPDLLSGVIAIEGRYPVVPGWEPPLAPMDGLPVLLVDPPGGIAPAPGMLTGDDLVRQLNGWSAAASRVFAADTARLPSVLAPWVAAQEIRIRPAAAH
jgi:hypothetical protein